MHTVLRADRHPIFERDPSVLAVARSLPRIVILQAGVDVVGIVHVHADGIDLPDAHVRKVVAGAPPSTDTLTPPSLPSITR